MYERRENMERGRFCGENAISYFTNHFSTFQTKLITNICCKIHGHIGADALSVLTTTVCFAWHFFIYNMLTHAKVYVYRSYVHDRYNVVRFRAVNVVYFITGNMGFESLHVTRQPGAFLDYDRERFFNFTFAPNRLLPPLSPSLIIISLWII